MLSYRIKQDTLEESDKKSDRWLRYSFKCILKSIK